MRLRLVRLFVAAALLARPLTAQTPALPAPVGTPPHTPAPVNTPTASQAAAAHALFKILRLEESLPNTTAAMVEAEIAHNPQLTPYRDVLLAWLRKYMTWDAMLPQLTQLYCETYTEGDMKALALFYASPVGQKVIAKTPDLATKTAAIGAKVSQPHTAELNGQLNARRDELKAKSAAAAGSRTPGAEGTPAPASAIPAQERSVPTPK